MLPKIFERAGAFRRGTITGFFTVLVEGDDFNEPIVDAVRGILDGHIILSRQLGAAGHYPAIDVLSSISRVASAVAAPDHMLASRKVREALACYQNSEDLIQLGAYVSGSNPTLDRSIRSRETVMNFLRQNANEKSQLADTLTSLSSIAAAVTS
jgi:flagellar biosynthesis/type III secretory pathway ATPase